MGAIYNIYSECETFWRKPSYCNKQQSIYPFLWQLSPLLQCTHPQSTQQRLQGAPQLAERCPVPQLTLLPRAFSLLHSFYGPGSAGFFPPCTWACFRFLFHEILVQKNLPILIWQAWDRSDEKIVAEVLVPSQGKALLLYITLKVWRHFCVSCLAALPGTGI